MRAGTLKWGKGNTAASAQRAEETNWHKVIMIVRSAGAKKKGCCAVQHGNKQIKEQKNKTLAIQIRHLKIFQLKWIKPVSDV